MKDYLDLVERILAEGERRDDRTGTGTLSVFGGHVHFDLRERFPLLQHKETRWKTAFIEMLWFLRGDEDPKYLHAYGVKLWNPWLNSWGGTGPIYGSQWRRWPVTQSHKFTASDQVRTAIQQIKENPQSRRILVNAWNVGDLDEMCLPPCHFAHQLYCSDEYLDLQVYQRSWDVMLGAPFNICQYALLLQLYARATNKTPRYLHFAFGDAHIYRNHLQQAKEMWCRRPEKDQARLVLNTDNTNIDGYKPKDFEIQGYKPEPFMKLEVAV